MNRRPELSKSRFALACQPMVLVILATQAGCTDWSYRNISLGQESNDYERVLPAATSRRTAVGLCHLNQDRAGRTDALVVLLTDDRRVAGKIWARHFERNWGFSVDRGYLLEGVLDPALYEVPAAGPIDALRAIAAELTDYRGEKLATDAHAWIAAGLVRLMQRWPGVDDVGVASEKLGELFERVPGGGVADVSVDSAGIYHFSYSQGNPR